MWKIFRLLRIALRVVLMRLGDCAYARGDFGLKEDYRSGSTPNVSSLDRVRGYGLDVGG